MGQHTPDSVVRDFFTPFQTDGFAKQTGISASDLSGVIVKKDGTALSATMRDYADEADSAISYGQVYVQNATESSADKGTVLIIWKVPDSAGTVRLDIDYAAGKQRYSIEHDLVIGVPDTAASEKNTLRVFQDAGKTRRVPRASYTVRTSANVKVGSGFTDVSGEATLPLPPASGYKVLVDHPSHQFNELVFAVAAGGGSVDVVATVNTQTIVVLGS